MRVLLTSLMCAKGDLAGNLAAHHRLAALAADAGCDLVLLPEMSLTGYLPSAAVRLDHPFVAELVSTTSRGPALCFGLVETGPRSDKPFITQLVADRGEIVVIHRKAHLGEDEDTDFQAGVAAEAFTLAGTTCSLAVCAEIGHPTAYDLPGARVVLGPSAPGLYGDRRTTDEDWRRGWTWWRGSVIGDAARLLRRDQVLLVSTQAGVTDDEDFPGWAGALAPGGVVEAELADWREGTLVVNV